MSEPENFLTRWSRRKREVEQAETASTPSEEPASVAPASATPAAQEDVREPDVTDEKAEKAPEVDLSALPSLESITAATDIRAFLLPGVPAELTRAALRRAWVADPAIRDFVGLAENAWDFTAPDTVPGFGSSVPADVARRLIAGMLGEDDAATPAQPEPGGKTATEPDVSSTAGAAAGTRATTAPSSIEPRDTVAESRDVDAAVHKDEASAEVPAKPVRQHGGALPS